MWLIANMAESRKRSIKKYQNELGMWLGEGRDRDKMLLLWSAWKQALMRRIRQFVERKQSKHTPSLFTLPDSPPPSVGTGNAAATTHTTYEQNKHKAGNSNDDDDGEHIHYTNNKKSFKKTPLFQLHTPKTPWILFGKHKQKPWATTSHWCAKTAREPLLARAKWTHMHRWPHCAWGWGKGCLWLEWWSSLPDACTRQLTYTSSNGNSQCYFLSVKKSNHHS